ncbi:hypothetical protein BH23GEM8_BH23GEM8_09250 [soil metagenome]
MNGPDRLPTSLPERRERLIESLTRHYTSDGLDDREFERRLDLAYSARSIADLEVLLADLPALARAPSLAVSTAIAGDHVRPHQALLALLGGTERKGSWRPAREIYACAMMGGLDLDFREAHFAPGVTELNVVAIMGAVDIIVPPGLRVECEGFGLLGGFDDLNQDGDTGDPDRPTLRVRGVAVMGGVGITERRPGESNRDRKRRLREERRERLRLVRG